jgi:hypothetical protein
VSDTTEPLQGTLDLLILKAVSLGPLHGYGVLAAHSANLSEPPADSAGLVLSRTSSPRQSSILSGRASHSTHEVGTSKLEGPSAM